MFRLLAAVAALSLAACSGSNDMDRQGGSAGSDASGLQAGVTAGGTAEDTMGTSGN